MKILFGINNDDTVKGIAEFYEQKYNEKRAPQWARVFISEAYSVSGR